MTDHLHLRLMFVLAHPDDESLGMAGTLARYAAEGVELHLLMATRGERGWPSNRDDYPGPQALGQRREAELYEAARILGVRQVTFLDYMDGEVDQVPPIEAIARIARHVRQVKPHVVATFGPDGGYGHPDHIAISQLTCAALICAADATYASADASADTGSDAAMLTPYRVPKLYYKVWTLEDTERYTAIAGNISMWVDGVERRQVDWEPWSVTTWIDTGDYWETAWQAIQCHQSQLQSFGGLASFPLHKHQDLWGRPHGFYRVYSTVNGGRQIERDLFAGLRDTRTG